MCLVLAHCGCIFVSEIKINPKIKVMNTDVMTTDIRTMFASDSSYSAFMDMVNDMDLVIKEVNLF